MKAKILLLVPQGLVLGGCATMDFGGPATTYAYPSYTYSDGTPAIVAPPGSDYSYGASPYDYDGDRVHDSVDRFPYNARRW